MNRGRKIAILVLVLLLGAGVLFYFFDFRSGTFSIPPVQVEVVDTPPIWSEGMQSP